MGWNVFEWILLHRWKNVRYYNKQLVNTELFPEQNISRAVYEDPDGRYWVSVSNEGVGELDTSTGKIRLLRDKHPKISFHKRDYGFILSAILLLRCLGKMVFTTMILIKIKSLFLK